VAAELVAFGWICELLDRYRFKNRPQLATIAGVGACVALLADPWAYQTIAFDFHMEAFTCLFALLAARALWAGRTRALVYWVPLCLLSAVFGGLAVLAVGVSGAIAGRSTRRIGLVLILIGAGWFFLFASLGAVNAGGQALSSWYGYLTDGHSGVVAIGLGLVRHPLAALHVAASRWYLLFGFLAAVGLIGVAWQWALPMAVVTLVPDAVNANVSFMLPHAAFQNWPALPFVLVGSVVLLVRLADSTAGRLRLARMSGALWLAALIPIAAIAIPEVPGYWLAVNGGAQRQLQLVEHTLPTNAEVIASGGISGRLSTSNQSYFFYALHQEFPVTRTLVLFVLAPHQGVSPTPPWQTDRAIDFVTRDLGAKSVIHKDGVFELEWSPPPGVTDVEIG
jgi:hypothetical protein